MKNERTEKKRGMFSPFLFLVVARRRRRIFSSLIVFKTEQLFETNTCNVCCDCDLRRRNVEEKNTLSSLIRLLSVSFLLRVANTIRSFVCIFIKSNNKRIYYLFSWISSLAVVLLVLFFSSSPVPIPLFAYEILILIKMKTHSAFTLRKHNARERSNSLA